MPWRAVEEMHWRMGRAELAQRAGVREFVATPDAAVAPGGGIPITTSFIPSGSYQQPPASLFTASPRILPPPGPPPQASHRDSPIPLPPHTISAAAETTVPAETRYFDPTRPPPSSVSRPQSPTYHSHRSISSHTSSQPDIGHLPQPSGPEHGSPRRHGLSSRRPNNAGIAPLEGRIAPTPPLPLPPLPKDIISSNLEHSQGPTLPPVRLLKEEIREHSRYTTPSQPGPSHSGSGQSRSHSTASGNQSIAEQRPEDASVSHGP